MSETTRKRLFCKHPTSRFNVAKICYFGMVYGGCACILLALAPLIGWWSAVPLAIWFVGSSSVMWQVKEKWRRQVRDVVGSEENDDVGFVDCALRYLGHETRRVSDHSLVVDGEFLVYVGRRLDGTNMERAFQTAEKEGASSVSAVVCGYDLFRIRFGAVSAMAKHGINLHALDDVFGAAYDRIKADVRVLAN